MPYVAGDAFAWFAKIKQWRINMQMQKMSQAQQKYMQSVHQNLGNPQNEMKVLEFSKEEMDGLSDMFAYLQDGDAALPHSYFSCNKVGQDKIITPPQEINKIGIDRYKKINADMERERKKQDETFKRDIENFKKQFI